MGLLLVAMLLVLAMPLTPSGAQTDTRGVAPVDLSGDWSGSATLKDKELNYAWSIQQNADKLSGFITLSNANGLASYRFEGEIQGDRVTFRGTQWLSPNAGFWCMASGELRVVRQQNAVELKGHWTPNATPGGCPIGPSGEVDLRKKIVRVSFAER
jgi:hypothetical protein